MAADLKKHEATNRALEDHVRRTARFIQQAQRELEALKKQAHHGQRHG